MEDILTLIQVFFWIALILVFFVGFNIWDAGNDLKNQKLKTSGMILMLLMIASIIFYFVIKSKTNSASASENASPNIEAKPVDKPIEEAPPPPQTVTAAPDNESMGAQQGQTPNGAQPDSPGSSAEALSTCDCMKLALQNLDAPKPPAGCEWMATVSEEGFQALTQQAKIDCPETMDALGF